MFLDDDGDWVEQLELVADAVVLVADELLTPIVDEPNANPTY